VGLQGQDHWLEAHLLQQLLVVSLLVLLQQLLLQRHLLTPPLHVTTPCCRSCCSCCCSSIHAAIRALPSGTLMQWGFARSKGPCSSHAATTTGALLCGLQQHTIQQQLVAQPLYVPWELIQLQRLQLLLHSCPQRLLLCPLLGTHARLLHLRCG
jgi:hypothetical protein